MIIYTYAEHCVMAGRVCLSPHDHYENPSETNDLNEWAGSQEEIFQQIMHQIESYRDFATPSAMFAVREARNVLTYLSACLEVGA